MSAFPINNGSNNDGSKNDGSKNDGSKNDGSKNDGSIHGSINSINAAPAETPVEVAWRLRREMENFRRTSSPQELRAALKIALQAALSPTVPLSPEVRQAIDYLERHGVFQAEPDDDDGFDLVAEYFEQSTTMSAATRCTRRARPTHWRPRSNR
jgi:hypothetical protein